ncbi:MAG: two-component regulator propeller domain-containing protein [Saprospiraceae bacterium]
MAYVEFYKNNPNSPYSPYEIYTIYKDSKGNIWFGTSNFGICRYDGKSLSWRYEKHLTLVEDWVPLVSAQLLKIKRRNFGFAIPIIVTLFIRMIPLESKPSN